MSLLQQTTQTGVKQCMTLSRQPYLVSSGVQYDMTLYCLGTILPGVIQTTTSLNPFLYIRNKRRVISSED
jgi:hypothetical protein